MAQWEQIESRTVSGQGVLRVPALNNKFRAVILYCDVVRPPKNKYVNKNWNPERGKYAFLTFVRNEYVIGHDAMEFDRQSWDGIQDISGQTLIAVKCAYDGILQTFVNLSIALAATPGGVGLMPINKVDLIKDYENLANSWQEVRIKCYADTAVQARLFALKYDSCTPDRDDERPPPPPPSPPPPVPPGTPLNNISPPYDRFTNDNRNTVPFPGDTPGIPPNACQDVTIFLRADWLLNGSPTTYNGQVTGKASVINAYIDEVSSGGSSIFVVDRRGPSNSCLPTPAARRVERAVGVLSNLRWYVV